MPAASTFYPRVFALVVAAVLGAALILIFRSFFSSMSWAAFLAFLLHPLNRRLRLRMHGTTGAAAVLTALTPIVIVLPLAALSIEFVSQISSLLQALQHEAQRLDINTITDLQQIPLVARADAWLQAHFGASTAQLEAWVIARAREALQHLATLGGSFFLGALGSVVAFSMMLFLLFFFLSDGDVMCARAIRLIPMADARKHRLFRRLADVARAIVFGTTVNAALQGLLVGCGFAIAGLPAPVVVGVVVALAAMLPVGAAAFAWVPAVGWLAYQGRWGFAVFMLAWGLMLSGLDNVVRPMLISGHAKISGLAVFIGALGGISAFGTIGIIAGPVVLSLAMALIEFAEESAEGPRLAKDPAMDVSHLLDDLNDAQRQAVASPLGAALVLAGAGSGKTRVLVHRVAWLIQVEGASPHSILAVTFTNKAAAEMRSRIETLLGFPGGAMWIGTFHGLAHRLLRLHWREAGLPQSFQILDSEDQARVLRKVLKALDLDETRWVPREILWFINAQKDEGLRPRTCKDDRRPDAAPADQNLPRLRGGLPARRRRGFRRAAAARLRAVARQRGAAASITGAAFATCWWTSSRTPTPSSTTGSRCSRDPADCRSS